MIRQSIKTMINIVTVIHSEDQKVLYEFQHIRISLFPSVTSWKFSCRKKVWYLVLI